MEQHIKTSGTVFCTLVFSATLTAQVPAPAHVVIVLEENHDYSQIIGSAAAPYINSIVAGDNVALFTHSYAVEHPSQPNYLALFSGMDQEVTDDGIPAGLPFTTDNLGASLLDAGKTFAGYSEDLPYTGYNGAASGAYARKHNPWANWQGASTNGIPPEANLPFTSFPANYDSLPSVAIVVPNQNNDMHNGTDPATITTGDTWLQNHLDAYVRWAQTHNSLFVLTFDEGTSYGTNRIATIFVGQMVAKGQYGESINHYSVLRTVEEMYGLPYAGNSAAATPITDCWTLLTDALDALAASSTPVLEQNYPNPFNPLTSIVFDLPAASHVNLTIWNTVGQQVVVLLNEHMQAGRHRVDFMARDFPSGVYYCQLTEGTWSQVRKLVLLR
jgi:acid phosphatase